MEEKRRVEVQEALIGWAVEALARWTGESSVPIKMPEEAVDWFSRYGKLLSPNWEPRQGKGDRLQSIFSLIRAQDGQAAQPFFVPARPLSLETLLPTGQEMSRGELWNGFIGEFGRLPKGEKRFETFIHLFYKYAWALPCTYGEPGVSLYEEFKALAALVHASGGAEKPAEEFLLVGGDIPGIQDFVYTITSKGAAKGLRGRSFFLQLLGDAMVRRLVTNLGLCPANVIYSAGGNFTLLAPAGSEPMLEAWQTEFNRALLKEFEGDLYLALAWESLPQSGVKAPGFAAVRERLGAKVAAAKNHRFAEVVAKDGWKAIFEPQGRGGLEGYCHACQREPPLDERLVEEITEGGEAVSKCKQCRGFEVLAGAIAHDDLWAIVCDADETARKDDGWQGLLARLTGFAYRFEHEPPQTRGAETVYAFNDTDLARVSGFRFVANVTPHIEEADREWIREHSDLDLEIPPGERIKDFALLALQSEGIPRVGVLRMDVDNLGAIFGQYLRGSLAQVSALSAALDLFFTGHLNHVCGEINALGECKNVLYTIYAGGDDLFVVGAWDRMPMLAERIRGDFAAYTGHNPHLTLSGGVTLEGRKFPLYRAAERAGEAEAKAKGYTRPDGRHKDAFCFLGQAVGWGEEWKLLRETKETLSALIGVGVPRSLLRVAQTLHAQFITARRQAIKTERRAGRKPVSGRLYWGRWAWMAAYSLTRLARGRPKDQEDRILNLQREWIESGKRIHLLGLAARWAEYQLRGGEK